MDSRKKRMEMIEEPEDLFEGLYNYIDQFDENWKKGIISTTSDKIQKFKEVSCSRENYYEFPKSYELFLEYMGEDDGGLLSEPFLGTSNIDDIIEYYIENKEILYDQMEMTMKENQILFFINEMEAEYYITIRKDGSHMINTNFDDFYEVDGFSESFEKMLFQIAFEKYEKKYFKNTINFITSRSRLDKKMDELKINNILTIIDEYAKNNGFHKAWASDKWNYIGIREESTLYVNLGFSMGGYISGDNKEELDKIMEELCNIIDVDIQ